MNIECRVSFVSGRYDLYGNVEVLTDTFHLYLGYSDAVCHNLAVYRYRDGIGYGNRHDLA